jgi:transportin-1
MHLESLVPFLIQKLDCPAKEVRSTTCWTLSKFSDWIGQASLFTKYHAKLVQKISESEEDVQEAACTAYSSLVEVAPTQCQPLLLSLFEALSQVVDNYKDGPLIAMLDCVGSIAQAVGDGLQDEAILNVLLPLLSRKWE